MPPFLSYLDPVTAGPWGVLVCRADTSTYITVLDWSWWKGKKENGQTELYPAKKQKSMPAAHQPGNPSSSVWENHLTFPGLDILSSKRSGLGWGVGRGTRPGSNLALKPMLSPSSDSDGAKVKPCFHAMLSPSRHQFPLLRSMVKDHTPEIHQSSLRWWWLWRWLRAHLSPPPEKSF